MPDIVASCVQAILKTVLGGGCYAFHIQMRTMSLGEIKELAQDHTASKQQSWGLRSDGIKVAALSIHSTIPAPYLR